MHSSFLNINPLVMSSFLKDSWYFQNDLHDLQDIIYDHMKSSCFLSSFTCQPLELYQGLERTFFMDPYNLKASHSNYQDKGDIGWKKFSLLNSFESDHLTISFVHIMKLIISMAYFLF